MRESQQVLEWQAEARQEGELKGKVEGELKGKAELVLRLLERRAGATVPADLVNKVRAMTDSATLDEWFDIADDVTSLKEFRKRIKG